MINLAEISKPNPIATARELIVKQMNEYIDLAECLDEKPRNILTQKQKTFALWKEMDDTILVFPRLGTRFIRVCNDPENVVGTQVPIGSSYYDIAEVLREIRDSVFAGDFDEDIAYTREHCWRGAPTKNFDDEEITGSPF